jgi:hypothetical protein
MGKEIKFRKDCDIMGFGLFISMLEKNGIIYTIIEENGTLTVIITGHKI